MGKRSSRRRLTLDKETLGRLTLSPAELQRAAGGAATYTCLYKMYLASNTNLCQSGD